jgi:hypothetical protein
MNQPSRDLTASNKDYAVFLPSISSFYTKMISNQRRSPGYLSDERMPNGFEHGIDGCDFLKQMDTYYNYKWGLYSAGHATLDTAKSDVQECMIQKRDRSNTFILGDSGGFQIAKGVIKMDWANFKTEDKLRSTILNWLEHTSDYSMVLDIPTLAALPPLSEKTGLKSFADCLDYTKFNNDYFVRNRQGKTKFLNVLQGNDEHTADIWYEATKHYPFEGWAMAGYNMKQLHLMLRRLIVMRDEKMLDPGRDLIHYLGTAKLDWGCVFTQIQRSLRETVNENMMVTYDAASPFITTAKGQMYTQNNLRNDKFGYVMEGAIDDKLFAGSQTPFPFAGPIAERLNMGDICHYAPGMLNKIGKEGKTSWDSFSYFLLMAHNVYVHIDSVQRANQLTDVAIERYKTDHKHWQKVRAGKKIDEFDAWVPRNTIYVTNFIKELFKSETPMQLLEEAQPMLADFSGQKSIKTSASAFDNLFDASWGDQGDADFTENETIDAEAFLQGIV